MIRLTDVFFRRSVAPLAGSVDRNRQPKLRLCKLCMSLPSRGAWIEISKGFDSTHTVTSLPSRGAWIEITRSCSGISASWVAPLAGSVDRNSVDVRRAYRKGVAPLAGSVDRNQLRAGQFPRRFGSLPSRGAWIEMLDMAWSMDAVLSLPSRGAWIEIFEVTHKRDDDYRRSPRGERG